MEFAIKFTTENLGWGLGITVVGMGLVFSLLVLLWGMLNLVLKLDSEPVAPAPAQQPVAAAEPALAATGEPVVEQAPEHPMVNGMQADLVAAIMTATLQHRNTLRRQAAPLMRTTWPGSQLFASRWVAAGRARQTNNWQPRGK